jgi:anti-anti-sigma regulatory factor
MHHVRRHGSVASAAGLGVDAHLCWDYDDDEDLRVAGSAFLHDGVRLGQRIVYVTDAPAGALVEELGDAALDVVPLGDLYDVGSGIVPERQLANFAAATAAALADGHSGLRVLAEITPLVRDPARHADFARWEHLVDCWISRGNPLSLLCAYDSRILGPGTVDDIFCVYPLGHTTRRDARPFRMFADGHDVALGGEVDAFGVPRFSRVLTFVGGTQTGIIDLSAVDFLDHRALIALADHGRAVGGLTLRGAQPVVKHVWDLVGRPASEHLRWAA